MEFIDFPPAYPQKIEHFTLQVKKPLLSLKGRKRPQCRIIYVIEIQLVRYLNETAPPTDLISKMG
ncbi:hypothetical protein EBT16_06235 [bacterium]|nr:hypothetical protein [bacterium]